LAYFQRVFAAIGKCQRFALKDALIAFLDKPFAGNSSPDRLLDYFKQCFEEGNDLMPTTFLHAARALAQLGDHRWAADVHSLITNSTSVERDPFLTLAVAEAVRCLDFLGNEDTIPVLAKLNHDSYFEVRQNAVWTLYLIGTNAVIAPLIGFLEDNDWQTRNNALIYIRKILGQWPAGISEVTDIDAATASDWWSGSSPSFPTDILLRNGQPIDYGLLIDGLKDRYYRQEILDELVVYLGTDFGREDFCVVEQQYQLPQRAADWWTENGNRFEKGKLYRMGRLLEGIF
jgi:hypothetical protein